MNESLIDREQETDNLLQEIKERQNTYAKILVAKTGTGKSSIVEKLKDKITDQSVDMIPVIVQTKPINEANNVQNGDYLKEVFKNIRAMFDARSAREPYISRRLWKKLSFSNYVANCKNKFYRREFLEALIEEDVSDPDPAKRKRKFISLLLKLLVKRIFKLGTFNEKMILKHLDDHYDMLSDYIIYCLSKSSFLLNIDNIQNIDPTSYKYLLEWINYTKSYKNVFIFEFTTVQDNIEEAIYLQNSIERSAAISAEILPVSLLDPDFAVDIALNCSSRVTDMEKFKKEAEIYYLNSGTGNIYDLKKFSIIYDEKNFNIVDDASLINLLRLEKNQQYLIGILILHSGKIKKDILTRILKRSPGFLIINIEEFLDSFHRTSDLIDMQGNIVKLTHASTIDTWKNNRKKFNSVYYPAYQACIEYYLEIRSTENYLLISRAECILFLLNAYAEFDSRELVSIIDDIEDVSISVLSAEDTWHYLEIIFNSISENPAGFERLYFRIIQICLQSELFDQAGYCLDIMKDSDIGGSREYALYVCIVRILREDYKNAQMLIEQSLDRFDPETVRYLCLLKIVILRSTNQSEKLSAWLERMAADHVFDGDYSEGYFLRLAEAYDPRSKAIDKIRDSIQIFKEYHDEEQAAKSRISLSFLYAVTGQLEKAKQESKKAEEVLLKSVRNRCIFYVNKAALKLLDYEFGTEVWRLLDEAEKLTSSTFNKTAVYINKLIWCIENKDKRKGEYCASLLICSLQDEHDRHMHAISFYNLYLYYKNIVRDSEKADEYYKRAEKHKEFCNTLKARLEGQNTCDGTEFLLTRKWHVCFLSYWDIDLYHLLNNRT